MTIQADISALNPSALIELFVLDLTSLGGDVVRFHAGTNELNGDVVWQANTYSAFPVEASGFQIAGTGQIPRPKIQVANITGLISGFVLNYNDMLGAQLTRKRTLAKYLDAVNFTGGINPTADPDAYLQDDVYFIDRKSAENKNVVEFELSAAFDVAGVKLPRRQIIRNLCNWTYRGSECGFTGAPVYDASDLQITSATTAQGEAVISAFNILKAARADLASKEVLLQQALTAKLSVCEYVITANNYSRTTGSQSYVYEGPYGEVAYKLNGANVSLGATYRKGGLASAELRERNRYDNYYYIETWAIPVGCAAATANYNTALANRDNAIAARATARANLDAAVVSLPTNDPLYVMDKCPKHLTSCKLRFSISSFDTPELPYGGFPASGLLK